MFAKTYFNKARLAAVAAGVSPGTAVILATESLDSIIAKGDGGPVTPAQGKQVSLSVPL